MDILNDGRGNNLIQFVKAANATGQRWKLTKVASAPAPAPTPSPSSVRPNRTTTVAPATGYYDPSGQSLNPNTASISKSQNQNYEWTVTSHSTAGWLIRTNPVSLPQGNYIAWVQVWHKNWTDKIGELRVNAGANVVARKNIIGKHIGNATVPQGEYQRVPLEFTLKKTTPNVSLEVYYSNNHYIWTGSTHITRLGDWNGSKNKRPIFAIAHRRNNVSRIVAAFDKENANAVELDLTPVSNHGTNLIGFRAHHRFQAVVPSDDALGWGTQFDAMPGLWQTLLRYLNNRKAACIVLDLKSVVWKPGFDQTDNRKGNYPYTGTQQHYAEKLMETLKGNGFTSQHLSRVVFSVPGNYTKTFGASVKKLGFTGPIDGYLEGSYPSTGAGYGRVAYVDQMEGYGADMLGVGIDAKVVTSPMNKWMHWLMEMANQRDRDHKLKKVYFWTVNSGTSIRKILDYGIDGMISDHPNNVYKVVNSSPYNQMVRMATQADSLKEVHGFSRVAPDSNGGGITPPPPAATPITDRGAGHIADPRKQSLSGRQQR